MTAGEVTEAMNQLLGEFMGKHRHCFARLTNFDKAWDKLYDPFWEWVRINYRDTFMKLKGFKYHTVQHAAVFHCMYKKLALHMATK